MKSSPAFVYPPLSLQSTSGNSLHGADLCLSRCSTRPTAYAAPRSERTNRTPKQCANSARCSTRAGGMRSPCMSRMVFGADWPHANASGSHSRTNCPTCSDLGRFVANPAETADGQGQQSGTTSPCTSKTHAICTPSSTRATLSTTDPEAIRQSRPITVPLMCVLWPTALPSQ